MERFVTVAPTGLSGVTRSKCKAHDNACLDHYDIIDNLGRNGTTVKESSQNLTSSPCERNWLAYDWVMSKQQVFTFRRILVASVGLTCFEELLVNMLMASDIVEV